MERPILFSAPMVQAIIAGRKTQTRRALVHQPKPCDHGSYKAHGAIWSDNPTEFYEEQPGHWARRYCGNGIALDRDKRDAHGIRCPYGRVGDRLWVRETWQAFEPEVRKFGGGGVLGSAKMRCYSYPAVQGHSAIDYAADAGQNCATRWRPSIHMPRWASRLTLEITGVRVERLNAISESDAMAEGDPLQGLIGSENTHKDWFCNLWQDTYGPGSWEANPWVWVIEFNKAGA